jgi:hypothetical protein
MNSMQKLTNNSMQRTELCAAADAGLNSRHYFDNEST